MVIDPNSDKMCPDMQPCGQEASILNFTETHPFLFLLPLKTKVNPYLLGLRAAVYARLKISQSLLSLQQT